MIVIDEEEIIEEIHQTSNSDSSNEGSDIEIEKISHSTALEQCKLLLQYVEQQDPAKFVQEQDLPRLRRICMRRDNKNVNRFFHEGITIALSDQLVNDNKGFYY